MNHFYTDRDKFNKMARETWKATEKLIIFNKDSIKLHDNNIKEKVIDYISNEITDCFFEMVNDCNKYEIDVISNRLNKIFENAKKMEFEND